jgi:predicted nucleic acid-binding protein
MSAVDEAALCFLDTNVIAYRFDARDSRKRALADGIVERALASRRGVISCQVVQEFLNLALARFDPAFTVAEAREHHREVLQPLCRHRPAAAYYDLALLLKGETGFHWFDFLIVAAAIELGCDLLLTEDLSHGQVVHGVTIHDPFRT